MNTVAEPNPAQTRSRPSRQRLFAWVRTLNLASACLLAAAAISLLVVIAQAPEVVHQLFRDADQDVSLVLPQLASHLPSGSNVDLGDHSWYEAWWFNRATIGLPDHFLIWEYAPYVILLLGIRARSRVAAFTAARKIVSAFSPPIWSSATKCDCARLVCRQDCQTGPVETCAASGVPASF